MAVLRQGSNGAAVNALQQALLDHGFDPGGIDGDFGDGTETAVKAFQASVGLDDDGVVGKDTVAALGMPARPATAAPGTDITAKVTVPMVARMFPGTLVHNITANLPLVLQELRAAGLGDKPMVLMALGTIRAETAGFVPIPEGISHFNTSPGSSHPFNIYDNMARIGNRGAPDGASFKGRGFVQLTGRDNYTKFGPRLAPPIDLVANPDQACDPTIAARLLALFLKQKEGDIRDALADNDLDEARKLVNGGSNGLTEFKAAFATGQGVIPDT